MTTPLIDTEPADAAAQPRGLIRGLMAALLLLVLGGVVGLATVDSSAGGGEKGGVAAVLAATDKTLAATSARFSSAAELKGGFAAVGAPAMKAEGVVDLQTGRCVVSLTSALFQLEVRNDGTTSFVRFPMGLGGPGASTVGADTWFALDNSLLPSSSNPLSGMSNPMGASDPSGMLGMLKGNDAVKHVTNRGSQDINGVKTLEYEVVLHAGPAKQWMLSQNEQVKDLNPADVSLADPVMRLLVDDQGLLRRNVLVLKVEAGGHSIEVTTSVDWTDFGIEVVVPPVPPSQVRRVGSLDELSQLLQHG